MSKELFVKRRLPINSTYTTKLIFNNWWLYWDQPTRGIGRVRSWKARNIGNVTSNTTVIARMCVCSALFLIYKHTHWGRDLVNQSCLFRALPNCLRIYYFVIFIRIRPVLPNLYVVMYCLSFLFLMYWVQTLLPCCAFLCNKVLLLRPQVVHHCWLITACLYIIGKTLKFFAIPRESINVGLFPAVPVALSVKLET